MVRVRYKTFYGHHEATVLLAAKNEGQAIFMAEDWAMTHKDLLDVVRVTILDCSDELSPV